MSVNHYLLPINGRELGDLLEEPERIRELVERREADMTRLQKDGVAIVTLTAESEQDPLAFMRAGAPDRVAGLIGKYEERHGRVVECEVDMGYGPASYYMNSFLREVAEKLEPITVEVFVTWTDPDVLEKYNIYPGNWHAAGSIDLLVKSFEAYRACVIATANSGLHLLVWCS